MPTKHYFLHFTKSDLKTAIVVISIHTDSWSGKERRRKENFVQSCAEFVVSSIPIKTRDMSRVSLV